jgi:hypothetical protein
MAAMSLKCKNYFLKMGVAFKVLNRKGMAADGLIRTLLIWQTGNGLAYSRGVEAEKYRSHCRPPAIRGHFMGCQ